MGGVLLQKVPIRVWIAFRLSPDGKCQIIHVVLDIPIVLQRCSLANKLGRKHRNMKYALSQMHIETDSPKQKRHEENSNFSSDVLDIDAVLPM